MGYESRFYLTLAAEDSTHLSNDYQKDADGVLVEDEKGDLIPTAQGIYSQVVAMVDVSKAGDGDGAVSALIQASIKAQKARNAVEGNHPWGFYVNGDEFVISDPYGDPLAAVDLDALIAALETELAADAEYHYRRFVLLLATARAWKASLDAFGGPTNARVLHYGY